MKPEYYSMKLAEAEFSPRNFVNEASKTHQKRTPVFDRLFALFVLVTISPVLSIILALILLGGQRPIFLQDRIGVAGKPFQIFKFRTIPDGGWDNAERAASTNRITDLRLSLFGVISRILRSTGLDELPQFANVLKGDMQIIGPRPLMYDDFIALPEGRTERCKVPPGITGFAQINGGQDLDSASKLALDIYLIDNLSFGMAARIVWRTIVRIVRGTAATATANARDLSRARNHLASRNHRSFQAVRVALESAVASSAAPQREVVSVIQNPVSHAGHIHIGSVVQPRETH